MSDHTDDTAWVPEDSWSLQPAKVTGTFLSLPDGGGQIPWPEGLAPPAWGDEVVIDSFIYTVDVVRWRIADPSCEVVLSL